MEQELKNIRLRRELRAEKKSSLRTEIALDVWSMPTPKILDEAEFRAAVAWIVEVIDPPEDKS